MVEELAELISDFPGPANQMRCFLHILNLVVKSIVRQFDLPKSKKTSAGDDDGLDQATEELRRLAGDIDLEEQIIANGDREDDDDDDDDGWIDECEGMTEEELKELAESVRPLRLLLVKVR